MHRSHVTILGSNSAVSVANRYPSGQVLQIGNQHILIDCGEGTQFRMSEYEVRKSKINTILITHLHGDHVFGLPGLLTSYQLQGRTNPLTILGPEPLKHYLDVCLGGIGHFINYPLEIREINKESVQQEQLLPIVEYPECTVEAFELVHRIECYGYKISEKPKKPKLRPDFLEHYKPDVHKIKQVLQGADFTTKNGEIISNEQCVFPIEIPRSYAYCSDTLYLPKLMDILSKTTTIYHESTYLHDLQDKAVERYHSTALEAAKIAKGAGAEQLILGHFSSRYKDVQPFADEANQIFDQVELAREGKVFYI